jgi:hypothetical protein
LFNVPSGSNGACGHTNLCEGGEGYNGPVGWGTPDGPLELTPKYSAVTEGATNITPTGAQLNGYVYTAGLSTTYRFEYGTTTSYGKNAPVPTGEVRSGATWQAVSQSISNLHVLAGTTYHYRLVTTNSSGTIDGVDHTFTTIPWVLQKTPNPEGSETGLLSGSGLGEVSCASSTNCMAVGDFRAGEEEARSLAENWNGTEWKIQSTPQPTGATASVLTSVSCTSSTACTSVGFYTNSSEATVPLAERWNGTGWSLQSIPNPTGAKASSLEGVWCTSSSACTAVGYYENSSSLHVTLAEFWNGTEWTIQSTPDKTGASTSTLFGVSCTSSSACSAVGKYIATGSEGTLAERWNGTEWAIQTTPNPTGASYASLEGVSCAASTACTAVGSYYVEGKKLALAERWNGTEWAIQTTASPTGTEVSLLGVSCMSSSECIAVGKSGGLALSERWNGTEWAIEPTPMPEEVPGVEHASLAGISCLSSKACSAVGSHVGGIGGQSITLAETRPIPKPFVESSPATSAAETTATLNGSVNPEGAETKYYFEYGTTMAYGSKTAEASAGTGTSNVEESKAISGLTSGTEYHFRIVATSSGGTTDGSDEVFSTSGTGKPSVETRPASRVEATKVLLNGGVNPEGLATKYHFEYGTTPSYGSSTTEASAGEGKTAVAESTSISSLLVGTTYHFRIVATNSKGTVDGADQVFSTTAKPTVETKKATSIDEIGATLNGNVDPKGAETQYYFEYGTTISYGSKTPEASAGSGTSNVEEAKAITGLTLGTTYHFRIVATNGAGTTDGEDQTFEAAGRPSVETKKATSIGPAEATLNGSVNPRAAETKYYFEYGTTTLYGSKTAEASAGSGTSNVEESQTVTGLEPGTVYHFRLVASNTYGTTDGADEHFTTEALSWGILSTLNPTEATESYLAGPYTGGKHVSCSSSTACTAVGEYTKSGYKFALAERWNGTEWSIQSTPAPTEAANSWLHSVSCPASTACTAVGYYATSAGKKFALAEHWNGTEWSDQTIPTPSGGTEIKFEDVSCSSSTACTAVGLYTNSAGSRVTLAERWNGTEWSIQTTSDPEAGAEGSQLDGVWCASSTICNAVGWYKNTAGTRVALAERWNGTEWSIQSIPDPSGATETFVESISCTSSTACTAVGNYKNSAGTEVTLAQRWNGTEWSLQTTLNPTGATASELSGVSCVSATACTAVGADGDSAGTPVTLAEHWNGTEWAIQSSPNPENAKESELSGVSCSSSMACIAAGYYENSAGTYVTLAEAYR